MSAQSLCHSENCGPPLPGAENGGPQFPQPRRFSGRRETGPETALRQGEQSEATKDPVNRTPTGDSYRRMSGINVAAARRAKKYRPGNCGKPGDGVK